MNNEVECIIVDGFTIEPCTKYCYEFFMNEELSYATYRDGESVNNTACEVKVVYPRFWVDGNGVGLNVVIHPKLEDTLGVIFDQCAKYLNDRDQLYTRTVRAEEKAARAELDKNNALTAREQAISKVRMYNNMTFMQRLKFLFRGTI